MGLDHPERCADCTTGPTCWINATCAKQRDSAKVEAPTPASDAQDSSYRAEIESLISKLAIRDKLWRDAEKAQEGQVEYTKKLIGQIDDMAERINNQSQVLTDQQKDIDHANNKICEIAEGRALAEQQRDQYQAAMLRQNEVNNELYLRHQAEIDQLRAKLTDHQIKDAGDYLELDTERQRLADELTAANDSLIAARAQIAALVADQRETDADQARALREYTTKQFHQQQASMAPSRGVSIPAAELEVTEQEDEAFNSLKLEIPIGHAGHVGPPTPGGVFTGTVDLSVGKFSAPRTSEQIRLDDIEQRMERAENAYLVLQGRVNTAFDRLDLLKEI